jgi:ABC-type glycerol-3-phosphate transport system substrate-binding protein
VGIVDRATRRPRRRILRAGAAGAAALHAAACGAPIGQGAAERPAVPAVGAARGEIRWLSRGNTDVQRQARTAFGTAFEERSPGVTVVTEFVAANEIEAKLQVAVAGGAPPELAFLSASQYQSLVVQQLLANLDEYVRRDRTFKPDDYFPIWLKGLQFKGQQFALPFDPSVLLLYYNRAAFDRAQLPRLDPARVPLWEDLVEVARRLTVDEHGANATGSLDSQAVRQVGIAMASYAWWALPRQNGQDLYAADLSQMALGQPAARRALQFYTDLRARHRVAVPSPVLAGSAPLGFEAGRAAMYWQGLWNAPGARAQLRDDWDVVPLPQLRGRQRVGFGWASGNAVVASARNPEGGWHFARHLAGPETQAVMMREGNVQPMLKSQANHPSYLEGTPPHSKDVAVKEAGVATTPPFYPHSTEIQNLLVPALDGVARGQESLDAMIDRLVPAMNEKLKEYRTRYGY